MFREIFEKLCKIELLESDLKNFSKLKKRTNFSKISFQKMKKFLNL